MKREKSSFAVLLYAGVLRSMDYVRPLKKIQHSRNLRSTGTVLYEYSTHSERKDLMDVKSYLWKEAMTAFSLGTTTTL